MKFASIALLAASLIFSGRIEIRLSGSKIDDLDPFGLEFLGRNHDLHGRGLLHVLEPLGKQSR